MKKRKMILDCSFTHKESKRLTRAVNRLERRARKKGIVVKNEKKKS